MISKTVSDSPAPAATAAPVLAADFPGWVPPMLVKELRQSLRAKGFVGAFLGFHALAVLVFWWMIEINAASGSRETFVWLNGVFWGLLNVVLLIVVPLRGLGALRAEIDNRTLDLLVLTRMSAWRIVVGKWISIVAQAVLFLVALLPYGVVRYFFGAVDLAADLAMAGWLFVASCALAAGTIWVSGLAKLLRIAVPVVLVIVVQSFGLATMVSRLFSGSGRAVGVFWRSPFSNYGWTEFFVIGLVVVAFLGLAVRRIAPPAENHSAWARGFAALLAAGCVALLLVFRGFAAKQLIASAAATIAVVALIELARDCLPMGAHWRPWRGRGRWRAAVGKLLLPGWPSAALFAAVMLTLAMLSTLCAPSAKLTAIVTWRDIWIGSALGWQALVFPALLLSFLPANSAMRFGGSGYFVLLALFGTISMVSASNTAGYFAGETLAQALNQLCMVLPVSSFLLGVRATSGGPNLAWGHVLGQVVMLGLMGFLVWRQSRPYWRQLAQLEARAKAAAAIEPAATTVPAPR